MIKEYNFNNKAEKEKIDLFLKDNEYAEYSQSIEWNTIRNENTKYYIYNEDKNEKIIWTCSLLEKSNQEGKYLYANRGPVLDYRKKELIENFFEEIEKWMKEKNYKKLIINPCIDYNILSNLPNNIKYEVRDKQDYNNLMDSCKLAIMDISGNEEELLSKVSTNIRRNTRKCYRKELTSKISKDVDFKNFYKLYLETSVRHNFHPHDMSYFKNIYKEFKENLIFIEIWKDDIPLAMSIDIIYNDKLIYLYGVSSTEKRNLLGMYNLQWEVIKYCIDNKIKKYDFGGVFCEENDIENKDFGLYTFKKGYCYNGFIDIVPDIIIYF